MPVTPDLRSSVSRIQLHPQLLRLFPEPSHEVPQTHNVVAMVIHGQAWGQRKKNAETEIQSNLNVNTV